MLSRWLVRAAVVLTLAGVVWEVIPRIFPSSIPPTPPDRVDVVDPSGRYGTILRSDIPSLPDSAHQVAHEEVEAAFPSAPTKWRPAIVLVLTLLCAAFWARRRE